MRYELVAKRSKASWLIAAVLLALLTAAAALATHVTNPAVAASNFPTGFSETLLDNGLSEPTAMAFAPDGRIFVAEQGGKVRVFKDGTLLDQPFVDLTNKVDSRGERGVLGVAFDPAFEANRYFYVYYTLAGTPAHNQVVRFTAQGDEAAATSETLVMRFDSLSGATNHNGGAIHFGKDGKLYVAIGDNATGSNAPSLETRHGKMLRINKDGTIPEDNPFFDRAEGVNRAIWARGLRNPYSFDVMRGKGTIFTNDVGQSTYEEINKGVRGANYGWPTSEGPNNLTRRFRGPIHYYAHSGQAPTGCAITGGTFYDPVSRTFPTRYAGDYFYADFCTSFIRVYDPDRDRDARFALNAGNPVDLEVSEDGDLYYLSRGNGAVYRVGYAAP
jgi:glucose/arabinose dehydrogenase